MKAPLGAIRDERAARQLVRFDGMALEGLSPTDRVSFTDVDALMEFKGVAWLMFEVKGGGTRLPTGQRLMAERFVRMARDAGRYAVVAVVEHHVPACDGDVLLSECCVRSLYDTRGLRWRPPRRPMTARALAEAFVRHASGILRGRGKVAHDARDGTDGARAVPAMGGAGE